jgi:Bacterial Ig domain/Cadherin domain
MTPAIAGNTYMNDFANVEVTEPNDFSFEIAVTQGSGTSATLTLRVNDVDEEAGELDEVYLNGVLLGYLSGNDGVWSTTSFNITSHIIYDDGFNGGINTVLIRIDPGGGEDTTWKAELDWGQILVDGGSAEDADITSVNASGTWNAIQVSTTITATNTDTYRLEINLLDSLNNNKDIASETFSLSGGASTTRTTTVSLPSEPTGSETFTVEALLFNDTTGIQQSVKSTTWTYSSEPPTDINLSNSSIDENMPATTAIGTLSAVDADSGTHQFSIVGGDIGSFTISGNELRSSFSFDHEAQETYNLYIEAEDEDGNTYSEWFAIAIDNVNEAPTAVTDPASVVEGSSAFVNVLANDADPEDDELTVASATTPSQGTASIQPDNTILYTPDPGACGVDSFEYTVEDEAGESDSASVSVSIQNVNPTTRGNVVETQEDNAVLIDVLGNATDPGNGSLTLLSVGSPAYGTAVIVGDSVRYTPPARFEGLDRIVYTIQDACGATATGLIDVRVLHTNHPPTANAGSFYQGIVDEPLILDASFSNDPDLGDSLQYRWDLDGDGTLDTDWSPNPRLTNIFRHPFFGQVILEVRDLYQGQPTGAIVQATAMVRIASIQSLQVFVFEDLDGNGVMDPGEPGLPDIHVDVAGEIGTTEADGGISAELDVGAWTVSLTEDAISQLESRGFAVLQQEETVNLAVSAIEVVTLGVVKTSTRLKGVVYADVNENGEFDEDDRLVEGVAVMLDGDEGGIAVTDASGTFAFRDVTYGSHELYVEQTSRPEDETPLNILIPFVLSRTEKAELHVAWPYDLGPQGGFLHVDVQREGEE